MLLSSGLFSRFPSFGTKHGHFNRVFWHKNEQLIKSFERHYTSWLSLYVSPDGNRLNFSSETNGVFTNYLSVPIAWSTNSWNYVCLAYNRGKSEIYTNGQLAAMGPGVFYEPSEEIRSNGFFVGSDHTGWQQSRAQIDDLATYSYAIDDDVVSNDYAAGLQAMSGGGFHRDGGGLVPPGGGGDTITNNYTPPNYGSNLWIAWPNVASNYFGAYASNTISDVDYEIQTLSDLTQTNWTSQGFFLGSETTNYTPLNALSVSLTNNCFIRLRSWIDSDGIGIPDWWQLKYFGYVGIDPYGDPTGDGWNNLQAYENGWNPTIFYTPPAPQGFTATFVASTSMANVNWLPSPGAVTGYILTTPSGTVDLPAGATNYADNDTNLTAALAPESTFYYSTTFELQASYAEGLSANATTSLAPYYPSISLVQGSQGSNFLAASALQPGTTAIRLTRADFTAEFSYGDYSFDASNDIPIASFTNGLFLIPPGLTTAPVDAYGNATYDWYAQTVNAQGGASSQSTYLGENLATNVNYGVDAVNPLYFDGRVQLKQNLTFLLRVATASTPFTYTPVNLTQPVTMPTNYVYASYNRYSVSNYLGYDGYTYISVALDPLAPFNDNYSFCDYVFNVTNLNSEGMFSDNNFTFPPPAAGITNIPALLGNSTWLTPSDPDAYTRNADYPPANDSEIGIAFTLVSGSYYSDAYGYFTMTNEVDNLYGLKYQSIEAASAGTNVLLSPGAGEIFENYYNNVYFYPAAAQPVFQMTGYDFWPMTINGYSATNLIPGSPNFSVTNKSSLLITGVGAPGFGVMGYAKMTVTNATAGVLGYLGQYFDQACQIDTNGIVTTDTTGVLSPYGSFFATQPGPAALVTMPDIDTGERGTCTVDAVSLQLDANHDGTMNLTYGGPDSTSQANPMKFWVNNGHCQRSDDFPDVGYDEDLPVPAGDVGFENCSTGLITCPRDLENFARLWVCGVPILTNGYKVTLGWNVMSGSPAINLYDSVETNGGTGNLTDTNIASDQCYAYGAPGSGYGVLDLVGPAATIAKITPSSSYTFPANFFTNSGNKYFLFEGAGIGSGELTLTISDNNSNMVAQTGVWLDLHDINDLFEQAHTTNIDLVPPSSKISLMVEDHELPPNPAESPQAIVFIHGLNNSEFDYYDTSETMYKRLYWEGYSGRFGAFRWPSPIFATVPTSSDEISPYGFDFGEYISWHSGAALKDYIGDLRSRVPGYAIDLAVHSLGNVAANEAIREGALVDNYALMQGAISAESFDGTNSALTYDYLADTATNSPDANVLGGYNNCATNATRRVNFYNDDDWALFEGAVMGITTHTWEGNELTKPNIFIFGVITETYSFDGLNCYSTEVNIISGSVVTNRLISEDFEKKSFVARSRTKAIGAAGLKYDPFTLTGGSISTNLSLQDASLGFVGGAQFGNTRPDHSGEFQKPVQDTVPFYFYLLQRGFQLQPQLSP
jgi:hypothetical protein